MDGSPIHPKTRHGCGGPVTAVTLGNPVRLHTLDTALGGRLSGLMTPTTAAVRRQKTYRPADL